MTFENWWYENAYQKYGGIDNMTKLEIGYYIRLAWDEQQLKIDEQQKEIDKLREKHYNPSSDGL